MLKTEFYETAVQHGFYGVERSGLQGKKDNVRKYWEDVSIKLSIRPIIQQILEQKKKIRIVDLGYGSGEGIELLTHIPPANSLNTIRKEFVLAKSDIDSYKGIDISPSMVLQGKKNYPQKANIHFIEADLSHDFPLQEDAPYDVYFSSYCSLSHLSFDELTGLTEQIFRHVGDCGYMVFDLHGRYSQEWPLYWGKSCKEQLPYNMGYLLPLSKQIDENAENFDVTYWNSSELERLIEKAAKATNRQSKIVCLQDRSILIGRHMDTAFFKTKRYSFRMQVNRLFDRDYRGKLHKLTAEIEQLNILKEINFAAWERTLQYSSQWKSVIDMVKALTTSNNVEIKKMIEESSGLLREEFKMLAWLHHNAERFPVMDFWASVIGPQIACVLRNLELNLPQGLGCGHSLFCIVEIR